MQRSSYNRKNPYNDKLGQTSYQRGFDYVSCHERFPLQLKGNMKKHSQPLIKDQIKSLINYQASTMDLKSRNNGSKGQKGQVGHQKKGENKWNNILAQKILTNSKMSKENYQKSIVPAQDLRSSKQRPQSVKTYKQNRPGSGINYLMSTDDKNLYKKAEKRHVDEYHIPKRQSFGKKCHLSAPKHTQSSQVVQCMNETQQKINSNSKTYEIKINSATFGVIHPSTTNKRLCNDIYSSYTNKQTMDPNIPTNTRYDGKNQFKTGAQLGYEFKKSKQIASQKINQMIGNEGYWKKTNQTESLRQKRDDWRRSAFVIE